MVLSLVYEVVARYVFDAPTLWAYDMTFMLYGSFFMLGSAYTLQCQGHIRTDSLYAGWSPRTQGIVDAICYVVMFMPFAAIFLYFGWGLLPQGLHDQRALRQQPLDADHLALQAGDAADRAAAGLAGHFRILQEPRRRDQRSLGGRHGTQRPHQGADMSNEVFGLLALAALFGIIFIGFPIAFTLGAVAPGHRLHRLRPDGVRPRRAANLLGDEGHGTGLDPLLPLHGFPARTVGG
jgi:hypothetical protein